MAIQGHAKAGIENIESGTGSLAKGSPRVAWSILHKAFRLSDRAED